MFIGLLLVVLGVLMLLDHMGIIHGDIWDYFWPLALVALGLSMIISDKSKKRL